MFDILERIDRNVETLVTFTGGQGEITQRLERIESSLYSGAGADLIIGSAAIAKILSSTNFVTGTSGWQITKTGAVEFEEATIRGTLYAEAGAFEGSVTVDSGGNIRSGQSAYDTGTGFYIGNDSGTTKFSIGNSSGDKLTWDGTNLTITGSLTVTGGTLTGSLTVGTGGSISSGQSAYNTGTGFWFEYNSGTPRFSIGAAGGAGFTWDGSAFVVEGAITATSGSFTGGVTIGTGGTLSSGQSAYNTGTGFWFENNSGTPRLSLGVGSGAGLTWNGSALAINGAITATSGSITGTLWIGSSSSRIKIDGSAKTIGSEDFSADSAGWRIDGDGKAEFSDVVVRGELRTAVFTKNLTAAYAGSAIWIKSAGTLLNDVTTVGSPTEFNVDIKDPDSHAQLFAVSDILRLKQPTGSGVDDNWVTVASISDQTTFYRYVCTLNNGSVATFKAGTAVVDYGQSGDGGVQISADGTNAPWIKVFTHAGSPWSATTERLRIGNLNGWGGFSSDTFGFAVGDYSGGDYIYFEATGNDSTLSAGGGNVTIDSNGITIEVGTSAFNKIEFYDSGMSAVAGDIEVNTAGTDQIMTLDCGSGEPGDSSKIHLRTTNNDGGQGHAYTASPAGAGVSGTFEIDVRKTGTTTNYYWNTDRVRFDAGLEIGYTGATVGAGCLRMSGGLSVGYDSQAGNADVRIAGGVSIGNDADVAAGYLDLASGAAINEFSIDGSMAGNSDAAVPTEKAVVTYVTTRDITTVSKVVASDGDPDAITAGADGSISLVNGTNINEFSTDGTMAGNSGSAVPVEEAIVTYVKTHSAFYAYKSSSTQTVSTASADKVVFDAELFDENSDFASSRHTPTIAGTYSYAAHLRYNAAWTDQAYLLIRIYKNGVEYARAENIGSGTSFEAVGIGGIIIQMNGSTDYVEVYTFHNTGSDEVILNSQHITYFTGSLVNRN